MTLVALVLALLSLATPVAAQAPLTVGLDGTFAPHAMPKLGGGVEGFNVDMANEIARRLGRPVNVVAQEFSGLIPGLQAKRFDFLVAPWAAARPRPPAPPGSRACKRSPMWSSPRPRATCCPISSATRSRSSS